MGDPRKSEVLAMTRDEILRAFESVRVWQGAGQRAPHKPLLILLELGRLAAGGAPSIEFSEAEPKLRALLEEFGPWRARQSPNLPFWHLQTDGLWRLEGPPAILGRPPGASATARELRENHIRGAFPQALRDALKKDPSLLATVARRVVDSHFPDSIRGEVLAAVGLADIESVELSNSNTRRRNPAFREKVLMAYQYRCGVCGLDLRLGRQTICLEAAHIKWFQANGPDEVHNGIALCSMHHKVFDLGVFTILPNTFEMIFSQELNGNDDARDKLLAYHGANLILPQSPEYKPHEEFLNWHKTEVFKQPARA